MRNFSPTLLAGVVALAVSAPVAAQFSNTYIFGDSLSDGGQYIPGARYTTNPGLTMAEYVAANFGLTTTPSFRGGTNYAQAGALMNSPQGGLPPGVPDLSVMAQVNLHLGKGPLDPNALYQVQGGGNDMLVQFTAFATGAISQAQLQGAVTQSALDLATAAGKLKAAGASFVLVQAMPDNGKAPEVTAFGAQASAAVTSLSSLFNTTLQQAIAQAGLEVITFNTFALMDEVIAQPGVYGFVNTTGVACTTPTGSSCTPSTLVAPNANTTYFFSDGHHGTTGAYLILSSAMTSMITGPQQIGTLAEAPLAVEDANFRALDGRMWSSFNARATPRKLEFWAAYDYGSGDTSAGATSGSADTNTIAVGGDMKVSDRLLIGGMFGYTENKGDFGGAGGGYKLRQPVGTFYAGYGEGPWYVGATLGGGGLDYSDVDRNIPLGPAVRTESGQTRGYEYTARLLGGYWLKHQDLLHGPYARMTYTKAIVNGFAETGRDSTALAYGEQEREQLLWSLGWQVAGSFANVRPFARVTWEYDSLDDDRTVDASSVTLGGSYSVPASKPDNSFALFNLGASADFGGITGFLTGSATAARGDANYWAVTVGIRAPL